MKRRWRAPNNPTQPAREVWAALFPGHPWPKGWHVEWAGFMRNCSGLTIYGRRLILLNYADARRHLRKGGEVAGGPVDVLLHEFIHLRCGPRLRHGREFTALENGLRTRLGFAPLEGRA